MDGTHCPLFSLNYAFDRSFIDGYSFFAGLKTLWLNFSIFLPSAVIGWLILGRAGAILGGISLIFLHCILCMHLHL